MSSVDPESPLLVLVFDRTGLGEDVASRVTALVDAGVDWLQVRDRSLEADALFAFTREVVTGARAASRAASVIVNRRIDVSLAAGADGVHLGFDALGVREARAAMGGDATIGVSCHSVEDVRFAAETGADYAHLAPIFDPISKPPERPALGSAAIRTASTHGLTLIAQGGVVESTARDVLRAGARGIAVTGSVVGSPRPLEVVAALRAALDSAAAAARD